MWPFGKRKARKQQKQRATQAKKMIDRRNKIKGDMPKDKPKRMGGSFY